MSRANRKRARRKLQAGRTPRDIGGAWHLYLPPSMRGEDGGSYAAAKVQQSVTKAKFEAMRARMFGGAT
jgi:hypothetical protein